MKDASKKIVYTSLLLILIFLVLPAALLYGKYSAGMLVSIPFGIGLVFALLMSVEHSQKIGQVILFSLIPIVLSIISCVIIAKEGAICFIIMGLLLLVPYYIGIVIGQFIQKKIWAKYGFMMLTFVSILTSATVISKYSQDKIIKDEIVVHMSKENLWNKITDTVSFGISENYFFKNGVSYPKSMHLDINDEQKYLHCVYNNGSTKARVISFGKYSHFAFTFNDSLVSMKEKNFYNESHTMHLQHHFEINYGKFEVEEIDSTQCKLIASTSYKHSFKPEFYTDFWVGYFVHNLHQHVLTSIRDSP